MSRIVAQQVEPVLLNKTDMCSSLNISTQAFDKWEVPCHSKKGRETFYTVADVVQNRLGNAAKKAAQSEPESGAPNIDFERYRLTKAQADSQVLKNQKDQQEVVETSFASFALVKLAAQIGSILDQVPLTIKRRFPELEQRTIDAIKAEIIKAQNIACEVGEKLPDILDDYLRSTDP
jgi:phage terminase Nu1 subunit (DNA packaging protein)